MHRAAMIACRRIMYFLSGRKETCLAVELLLGWLVGWLTESMPQCRTPSLCAGYVPDKDALLEAAVGASSSSGGGGRLRDNRAGSSRIAGHSSQSWCDFDEEFHGGGGGGGSGYASSGSIGKRGSKRGPRGIRPR